MAVNPMTPTTDWRKSFKKHADNLFQRVHVHETFYREVGRLESFIAQTIKAERQKAVAEALSTKVNRLEIIDHTAKGPGRAYVKWEEGDFTFTLDLQDQGRTLKIFLDDFKEGDGN